MISAVNSWILAFDNMSQIPPWLSDLMCRLATGGGMAIRTMYADMDETLFQASRPIILNGINSVTSEPDLADRSIPVSLASIGEADRKTEADVIERFNQVRPQIFGALCQAVSVALKNISTTRLARLPRMADFALWATAAEPAYCAPGEFMAAYSGNRQAAIDDSISASSVMDVVIQMASADNFTEWRGSATELLEKLNEIATDGMKRAKSWPKESNHLTRRLNKAAPQLRSRGIFYEATGRHPKTKRTNFIIHRGSESILTTLTKGHNQAQDTGITSENVVRINSNLPSPNQKLPSPDEFTLTSHPVFGEGKSPLVRVESPVVRVTDDFTLTNNTDKNHNVTAILSKSEDSEGKFAGFSGAEIIPMFQTDPEKPRVRVKV
jgi:hypothetical protein